MVIDFRKWQRVRHGTGGDNDMLGGNCFAFVAVDHFNLIGLAATDKSPEAGHRCHIIFLKQKCDAAGQLIDDLIFARQHFCEIKRDTGNLNAMIGEAVICTMKIFRRFEQGFRRNAADVQTRTAKTGFALGIFPVIDTHRIKAKLRRSNCRDVTTGTAADDGDIELLSHS